ncbi:MAG: DUF502 domain-containing protein [Dehalogenimonas sp.]|uniref:DUF502 domain-containing protein n=1 Tax=Candidatus Dehalogenimonas loeffleri TaxID=3127115 RepID=A0ABZ2J2L3_9CHLR|nr:DUF502 domain-containing protein [Dehalogenimonas sp.]
MFNKHGRWLTGNIKKEFTSGMLFLIPILASILILIWVFTTIDGILQPLITIIFGQQIMGLGILSTLLLIWGVGLVLHNGLGRAMLKRLDQGMERVPLYSQIYTGAKQVMDSLGGVRRTAFKETVLVDFPRAGMKALAFITNEMVDENGEKIYVVYVPTSPLPTSGFLQLLRENQICRPDLAVDCAMRMIVSGGMVTPDKCQGFGLADGYRSVTDNGELSEIPSGAIPVNISPDGKLKTMSYKLGVK